MGNQAAQGVIEDLIREERGHIKKLSAILNNM
jgi:rubrerythrin